ncbi:MAG: guanylate kinase [Caldithrix sp.]|nr:guanylate kinase [Caldithrix sp.]
MRFKSSYIIFSAPSGGGKTTIVRQLQQKYEETAISVSATTRPKRNNEVHGRDYFFLSRQEFEKAIQQDRFLEYEQVHGNYYGTLKETVENMSARGQVVLFDIDVNGALSIKQQFPKAISLFIKPPSKEELIRRLQRRQSERESDIRKRLQRLDYEYARSEHFDHIIINDQLSETINQVESLIIKTE